MGHISAKLLSAISSDVTQVGFTYEELNKLPHIPPDASHELATAYSFSKALFKKFLPEDSSDQDTAAAAKFHICNSHCETWELRLNTSGDEELFGTFKDELWKFFNPNGFPLIDSLDLPAIRGRCGPGASVNGGNGDFYTKMFSSPLTTTSMGLYTHYRATHAHIPLWHDAESFRHLHMGQARLVDGSKMSFVPKNDTISRIICSEPTLNMYYQLGIGAILTDRLRSYFRIDLSTQPDTNRELAKLGSENGLWATIDLESASDTISHKLCSLVLPAEFMSVVNLCRSSKTLVKGTWVDLHMVSTMGNGFTFPLQTAIFASACKAVYRSLGIHGVPSYVFGDDIVVHSHAYNRLLRLLGILGFKVNTSKSFNEGPFRESCGEDYYRGINIRGVYFKRLTTQQDLYAAINSLVDFGARTGFYPKSTVNWLMSRVDRTYLIPRCESSAAGIRVPVRLIKRGPILERQNRYQAPRYKCYVYVPRHIKIPRYEDGGENHQFTFRKKRFLYNPSGLFVAFLSGMALSSGLPLRDEGRWKTKRRSCSFWDSFESKAAAERSGFSWQQWETAVDQLIS